MLRSTTAGGALDDKVGHMEANNGMWTTGHSNRSLVRRLQDGGRSTSTFATMTCGSMELCYPTCHLALLQ